MDRQNPELATAVKRSPQPGQAQERTPQTSSVIEGRDNYLESHRTHASVVPRLSERR